MDGVDGVEGVDGEGDPAGVGDEEEEDEEEEEEDGEEEEEGGEEGEDEEEEEEEEDDGEGDESPPPSSPPGRERVTRNVSPFSAAAPSSIDRAPCSCPVVDPVKRTTGIVIAYNRLQEEGRRYKPILVTSSTLWSARRES